MMSAWASPATDIMTMATVATLMAGTTVITIATMGRALVISASAAAISTIIFIQDTGSFYSTMSDDDTRCAIITVVIGEKSGMAGIASDMVEIVMESVIRAGSGTMFMM